jgi:flagellar hook assembly protein FlgD
MAVYDLAGRRVKIISDGTFGAGIHTFSWDGTDESSRNLPPGVYILKLSTGFRIETVSMILLP